MQKKEFLNLLISSSLEDLLSLAKKKFGDVYFETIKVGPHRIEVLQIKDLEEYIDRLVNTQTKKIELPFWAKIWPASIILSYFLLKLYSDAKSLLEVGCGVGVCGLFAAKQGFYVTLSDVNEDALLFSQINILKNQLQKKAKIKFVDFTDSSINEKYHIILGSEVLYSEKTYEPFCKFLIDHILPSGEVIIAKEHDIRAENFFSIAKKFFDIKEKNIGLKSQEERHLFTIYRLTPNS